MIGWTFADSPCNCAHAAADEVAVVALAFYRFGWLSRSAVLLSAAAPLEPTANLRKAKGRVFLPPALAYCPWPMIGLVWCSRTAIASSVEAARWCGHQREE